jgi:hypothetical protein
MTELQHIYVTAQGAYGTGAWVGESAQFGIRLAIVPTGSMPAKGAIFPVPLNGEVVTDQGQTAGTHGTLTRTWTARRGPVGSAENCDAGFQIDLAEDTWTFLDALKAYQSNTFRWNSVKIAPVGLAMKDGEQVGRTLGTSAVYTFTTPISGAVATLLPPQCAMAVSTRANILGRRGRGRIYVPALAQSTIDTAGMWSGTPANAIRAAFVAYINALQNLPGLPDYLPMVSIMSPGKDEAVRPTEVRTGSRVDTIRSRREQVPETYTATAL